MISGLKTLVLSPVFADVTVLLPLWVPAVLLLPEDVSPKVLLPPEVLLFPEGASVWIPDPPWLSDPLPFPLFPLLDAVSVCGSVEESFPPLLFPLLLLCLPTAAFKCPGQRDSLRSRFCP